MKPENLTHKLLRAHLVTASSSPGDDITRGRRPGPGRGRDRDDGAMQFELLGVERCRGAAGGHVRRPQRPADRRQEHAGPPLPAVVLRTLRAAVLPARPRHLPLRAPRALRPAGRAAGRRRLAHHDGRRGRACSPPARAGWRSRSRWPGTASTCLPAGGRRELRPAAARVSRPRTSSWSCCAATACAAGGRGVRVLRRRRRDDLDDGAGDDLQHGRRDRRDDRASSRRDEETRRWLAAQERGGRLPPLAADPGAAYDERRADRPVALEPLVALPPSPGQRRPGAEVAGTSVGAGVRRVVGEQLLRRPRDGRRRCCAAAPCAPGVAADGDPGSRQILDTIIRVRGVRRPVRAPARGCSSRSAGRASASARRRMKGAAVAADVQPQLPRPQRHRRRRGVPVLPVDGGGQRADRRDHRPADAATGRRCGPPWRRTRRSTSATSSPRRRERAARGRRRARREPRRRRRCRRRCPTTIDAPVLIVVRDDISTGDMAPDGAIAMSVWSNIAACARFMFRRLDPEFHDRARRWGGGLDRRRAQLRAGLVARARRARAAAPRRARHRGRQLRADPPAQPHRRRRRPPRHRRRRPGRDRGRAALADPGPRPRRALRRGHRHRDGRRRAQDHPGAAAVRRRAERCSPRAACSPTSAPAAARG